MILEKIKNVFFLFIGVMLLSGCTATYNLEISYDDFYESLDVYGVSLDSSNYFFPIYYNSIDEDEYDVDVSRKIDGISYYNSSFDNDSIKFDYKFTTDDFSKSNFANSFYSSFVFKRYDYDEDGKQDYYILSTSDDFSAFDIYTDLTEITVKIKNNFDVISNNADEIDGNIYIWHFMPDKISSINMVYNPDIVVDNRTFLQRLKDGDYFNVFTLAFLIILVVLVLYLIFKNISKKKDAL